MKNCITLIAIGFLSSSCIKDYKSFTETKLINATIHTIKINSFANGNLDQHTAIELQPNEVKVVYQESPWGKTLSPCWGVFLQPNDSTVVIYNNTKKSNHLRFTDTTTNCDYCIRFENGRNISNEANYIRTVTKEEKKYLNGYFTYTFTEQDYLDAKE